MEGFNPHKCPIHLAGIEIERALLEGNPQRIRRAEERFREAQSAPNTCGQKLCCKRHWPQKDFAPAHELPIVKIGDETFIEVPNVSLKIGSESYTKDTIRHVKGFRMIWQDTSNPVPNIGDVFYFKYTLDGQRRNGRFRAAHILRAEESLNSEPEVTFELIQD